MRRYPGGRAYLFLACFAVMIGHADLVEEVMKLADDGADLLREIAGVHGEGGAPVGGGDSRMRRGGVWFMVLWRCRRWVGERVRSGWWLMVVGLIN